MARREERAYREYVSDEQRSEPRGPQRGSRVGVEEGCPARELCDESLRRDTSFRGTPTVDRSCFFELREHVALFLLGSPSRPLPGHGFEDVDPLDRVVCRGFAAHRL